MDDFKKDMGGTSDDKGVATVATVTASLRVDGETMQLVRDTRRLLGERLGVYGTAALPSEVAAAIDLADGVSQGDVVALGVKMLRAHLQGLK